MCNCFGAAILLFLGLLASSAYPQFYYGSSGPIPLKIDSNKVLIKFEVSFSPSSRTALIGGIERIVGILPNEYLIDDFECCSLSTVVEYGSFLDSLDTLEGIYLVEPYYCLEDGTPFPVGETFCVAFDTSIPSERIDSINSEHGVAMGRKLYGFESVYVLNNTDSSHTRILDLANEYYDMPETHFAHPNIAISFEPFSYKLYDFYGHLQDNIKKVVGVFNEKTVWDFADLGREVIVAVIDDGVEAHEDLPASRVLPGWDFVDNDDSPISGTYAHGMGCAGIIGASHTTDSAYAGGPYPWTGVISLNPEVKILPIKIYDDLGHGVGVPGIAEALNFARTHGAEVVSNSWGFFKCTSFMVIDSAILRLFKEGRGGLGSPIIFAAGNDAEILQGIVAYPACISYTLAVGATHLNDTRWYYSQYGSELDLVAPSGDVCLEGDVWSLDRMTWYGYNDACDTSPCGIPSSWNCPMFQNNDVDYNCHCGGTSAACPVVSGVASLLIARTPNLTVEEIYDVLRGSAVTNLDWGTIQPPDYEYGYGRVDAFRAMLAITRGDANNDGSVDVGDAVYLIAHIYKSGPAPLPDPLTGDANCNGMVDAGDPVYVINYCFRGGPAPQICFEY